MTENMSSDNAVNTGTEAGTAASSATQIKAILTSADGNVTQGVQSLGRVHQARLSLATRTAASLTAQYGANDARTVAAQASVSATKITIARISNAHRQLTTPVVQVATGGWALQGRVLDAQLQPAARFTVFLVDEKKTFLRQYGFSYTDETGYFVLSYGGESDQSQPGPQLFIEVANPQANPVYLSTAVFQPVIGTAIYQEIVLPADGQPIGDPPEEIRRVALPEQNCDAR